MEHSVMTFLLVVVTGIFSYLGLRDSFFMEKYSFDVDKIMIQKDYKRLITSGFLHLNWWHLIFNMIALLAFGGMLEHVAGIVNFLLIYFASLLGGNLFALWVHKNNADYSSVGASGAVNGVVFAMIALAPNMGIGFFFIPASIPAWIFGVGYMFFTIYGIKTRWGNSGHTAHLGGAVIGMLLTIVMYPEALMVNYLPILVILVPTLIFIFLVIYKPSILLLDNFGRKKKYYSVDHEYNYRKAQEQTDIDRILEKIHKKGMKSLTQKEREILNEYSKTVK